ncbi:MAG: hypothetical protein AAGF53_17920 [Pseudomonadota bacterium]
MSLADLFKLPSHVSKRCRFNTHVFENEFARADLHFFGVDHATYSYNLHVFLNNEDADLNSDRTIENGYAGVVPVFGHGGCYGGSGHCCVKHMSRAGDRRRDHPLVKAFKRLTITETLRHVLSGKKTFKVTIVPEITGGSSRCDAVPAKYFDRVTVVTYD